MSKTSQEIEVLVTAEELEHPENPEFASRQDKIQAAISRKAQHGVFDRLFPARISKFNIVVDAMKFNRMCLGYEVKARVIY